MATLEQLDETLRAGVSVRELEPARPTVVTDLSLEMLRRGMARVRAVSGTVPDNVVFLQADALRLPFADHSVATLLCHGAFHLLPSLETILAEWRRVLKPDGDLYASSLVKERLIGNLYLAALARAGEVSPPMTAEQVDQWISNGLERRTALSVEGNFAYVHTL